MTDLILLPRVAFRGRQIKGARLIGLIALLAGDLRTGCGIARLVEGLWPDKQPEHPVNAVQVLVSRARAQLGPETIVSTATGYRLALAENEVDTSTVLLSASAASRESRAGDHVAALAHAEAGLALWEEVPSVQSSDDPLTALRAERVLTYQSLVRVRALTLSRLGRHAAAVADLTALVAESPRDEELLLELLRCEHATIGAAAALTRYDEYRRLLRDELGTDPGPALQAMHQQLLEGRSPTVRYGVLYDANPLLGRSSDIAAVTSLMRTSRVTSIVGTGGLGKTRLAHVVSRQADQRAVYFVPFVGLAEGVSAAVESAVETTDLANALSGALLVLDNCEHVLDEVADLVRTLVSSTEDVRVLTTSRAPLGLSSEAVYLLPELDLPVAVELFRQRATAARPGVSLPSEAVEQLCRRLDGLPLALELAAARVRVMSVEEILHRLSDRFTLLRGGARDSPERHKTLQSVVEWSWQLLDPAGQAALPVLSVFPGGFTAEAAAHLLGSDDVLEHLVDHSLLKVVETKAGTRFRMLETVREFGALRRGPDALARFLAWARDFGRANYESLFYTNPYAGADLIRSEQDNLLHALRIGLATDDAPTVAATAAVLAALWTVESNYPRLHTLNKQIAWILSHYHPEPEFVDVTRAAAVLCTSNLFAVEGPQPSRVLLVLRRLPAEPVGNSPLRAASLALAAAPEYWADNQATLKALCDHTNPLVAGFANGVASYVYRGLNDLESAVTAVDRAIKALSTTDCPWLQVAAFGVGAGMCFHAGLSAKSRAYMQMSLPLLERLGAWSDVAQIRWGMVQVNLHLGEIDEAERWLALTALNKADDIINGLLPVAGARAEIALARGEIDAGLRQWRRAVEQMRNAKSRTFTVEIPGMAPWVLEHEAIAIVAHAQYGRLDLVADLVGTLPGKLVTLLKNPTTAPSPYIVDHALIGVVLIALSYVNLGDAPRMVALAQRFQYLGGFQPTMSVPRVRQLPDSVDTQAYEQAVAEFATMRTIDLRPAVLAMLEAR
ncbi:AfsR/SARP family transcriptional regulator [Kibdelosporangium philippinense]|uniref:AfsR/SARP family transcriptional regulator n=1 Tax=Kibdelosporangium philippinense TaxID=211113 RepID=A0ABS8Z629_9PSEU|nr:BTAD domain-containing putative transcriptional regulator [Kibdelosporangium philippinense]MCE7002957.1 AfsR/SARP family transcriptional regulator [Kibdelosporangium philippinense]